MSRVELLDHGFIELVETWGSDESIIEAARQSVGKGFVSWDPYEGHPRGDAGLLRFLKLNHHDTPFEFAGAIFEVQAPIFVFREWHRHRVQGYTEASARYAPLPNHNYVPTVERLMMSGGTNKQAGGTGEALTERYAERFRAQLAKRYEEDEELYQNALSVGVSKELARCCLPVARYSKMRATAVLRNWLGFLTLRMASNAQYEIRVYADAIHAMLTEKFPRTIALFDKERAA